MKRTSGANRLMTEVELALLSGRNLAELEAQIQASAAKDATHPHRSERRDPASPQLRPPEPPEPPAARGHRRSRD